MFWLWGREGSITLWLPESDVLLCKNPWVVAGEQQILQSKPGAYQWRHASAATKKWEYHRADIASVGRIIRGPLTAISRRRSSYIEPTYQACLCLIQQHTEQETVHQSIQEWQSGSTSTLMWLQSIHLRLLYTYTCTAPCASIVRSNDWTVLKIKHLVTCLATMAYVYAQCVLLILVHALT